MPKSTPSVDMTSFCVVDQAVNTMKHVESYITVGMELAIDVASDLGEYEKDEEGDCEEELHEVMLDYINMQRDFKQFIDSVEYMKKKVEEGAELETMESILHERVAELKSTNDDSLFKQHEKYRDLVEKIHEVRNPDKANTETRAITQNDSDDEVPMTEESISTRCPYTTQEMVNPVKNTICGHNYEKDGILEYISNRKHKAKCPVGGCINTNPLTRDVLEENKELRKIIGEKRGKRIETVNLTCDD